MKRSLVLFSLFVLTVLIGAGTLHARAQGGAPNPEREAARAKQLALEESIPQLKITEEVLPLVIPGHTIGETEGVSMNSKGHLFCLCTRAQEPAGVRVAGRPRSCSSSTKT